MASRRKTSQRNAIQKQKTEQFHFKRTTAEDISEQNVNYMFRVWSQTLRWSKRKLLRPNKTEVPCYVSQANVVWQHAQYHWMQMVSDIFTPRYYIIILPTARIRTSLYQVKELNHGDFSETEWIFLLEHQTRQKSWRLGKHSLRGYMCQMRRLYYIKIHFL